MLFQSDNVSGIAPELLNAIIAANQGNARPYYADAASLACQEIFSGVFGRDVAVFPVTSGTAANALVLAHLAQPYEAILCHETAHVNVDEAGAPEFFTHGAKLLPIPGEKGKLDARDVSILMESCTGSVHQAHPSVISISQPTEWGTCYTLEEIREITRVARRYGLSVHMDGARLANAVCHLGCAPAEVTWRAGIDALSFGGTKNGAMCAEAVVIFDTGQSSRISRLRKRAGHTTAKSRFISSQLCELLSNDYWLTLSSCANAAAQSLARQLSRIDQLTLYMPVEANLVFVQFPSIQAVNEVSEQGIELKVWLPGNHPVVRFACSYCTSEGDIQLLLTNIQRAFSGWNDA